MTEKKTQVVAIRENLISVLAVPGMMKNEMAFVKLGELRIKAEVLRIRHQYADLQVYENVNGLRIGDEVELTGELLSAVLGPGLLGKIYDGLQNPLVDLAEAHGYFLPKGTYQSPLDQQKKWVFDPVVRVGDVVRAGDVIGTVQEGRFQHKIMMPFRFYGTARVDWIEKGDVNISAAIAVVIDQHQQHREIFMTQDWPIRRSLSEYLLQQQFSERLYPQQLLTTTVRIIDSFFPIALGGTACIPGPFGAGKTVLQNLIAKYTAVDIVIIVACGERAGEIVETITEFPSLKDPKTGGSLMERTVIIANTSAMPVPARESSIYMGMTLAEYYRQMGHQVLIIADSTSRWAQAMREISGRMEEIPGEEAFPAYLDSRIKALYERAGVIRTNDQSVGSVTMIGTVSPAGGNFEEPVTQATLSTVKTFLGLSAERAYRRSYPAIDPLMSWSRYHAQLAVWFVKNLGPLWANQIEMLLQTLQQGESIYQMVQVAGEEGISLHDFLVWQKADLIDIAYLQQDAFDDVDVSTPLTRQKELVELLCHIINTAFQFDNKDAVRDCFTQLISEFKNLNYSPSKTPEFEMHFNKIKTIVVQNSV